MGSELRAAVIDIDRLLRQAVGDPGSFTPRANDYSEPLTSWCARAVLIALRSLPVEQRMEAMGMCERCGVSNDLHANSGACPPSRQQDEIAAQNTTRMSDEHFVRLYDLVQEAGWDQVCNVLYVDPIYPKERR